MRRFKNVLIITEQGRPWGPEVGRAMALARRNDAAVAIMETSNRLPSYVLLNLEGGYGPSVMAKFQERRRAELEAAIEPWQDLRPTLHFPTGKPFLDIIHRVINSKHDLVVKAAEPPPTASTRLFGSLDMHLLRKCPSAVWLHKPGSTDRIRRILACIDAETDDIPHRRLNTTILEMATSLAQDEGSAVDAAHAWWLPYESTLRDGVWLGERKDKVDELITTRRAAAATAFSKLVRSFTTPDVSLTAHFLDGDPRVVLTDLCDNVGYDLVIMGTVTQAGLPGYLIGETAETLLGEITVPVLAVKPEGWVSPVAAA